MPHLGGAGALEEEEAMAHIPPEVGGGAGVAGQGWVGRTCLRELSSPQPAATLCRPRPAIRALGYMACSAPGPLRRPSLC